MKTSTAVFLVLLRLALGWAILVEGLEKVLKPGWTSEPYLREATGPLAGPFRDIAGDAVADRLTVVPLAPGQDSARTMPHTRVPPALAREWRAYLDQFADHYGLNEQQRRDALTKLEQREHQTVVWILTGKLKIEKTFPKAPPVEVEQTPAQWVHDYLALRQKADNVQRKDLAIFGHAADAKFASAKADAAKVRSELQAALNQQNEEMRKSLALVPDASQKKDKDPLPYPVRSGWKVWEWTLLDWSDSFVKWGLTVVGACLIAGLFTRTACVVGAVLVLSFFLAMPPLLNAPVNPKAEGTYLYINKTFIMVMALLALATVPSGRWLGLDGLLQFVIPRRWRRTTSSSPGVATPVHYDSGAATPRPDLEPREGLIAPSPHSDNVSETAAVSTSTPRNSTDGN